MPALFETADGIAHIKMDDGKANAIGFAMINALMTGFDQAEKHGGPVILSGMDKIFCGGFDLKVMRGDNPNERERLVLEGAELIRRIVTFPNAVISVTQGHAIAMGFFIVLACDYRIGADADYRYWANETTIGLSLPVFASAVGMARLRPSDRMNALVLAQPYLPTEAKHAGIINEVVSSDNLLNSAIQKARVVSEFPLDALKANKLVTNNSIIEAISNRSEKAQLAKIGAELAFRSC